MIRVVLQDAESQEVAYDLRADKDKTMVRKWVKVGWSLPPLLYSHVYEGADARPTFSTERM